MRVIKMKYCKECKEKFKGNEFSYCPYCAKTLIEIIQTKSGLYQVLSLVEDDE